MAACPHCFTGHHQCVEETLGGEETDNLSLDARGGARKAACCLAAERGWGLELRVSTKYFIFLYLDEVNNN